MGQSIHTLAAIRDEIANRSTLTLAPAVLGDAFPAVEALFPGADFALTSCSLLASGADHVAFTANIAGVFGATAAVTARIAVFDFVPTGDGGATANSRRHCVIRFALPLPQALNASAFLTAVAPHAQTALRLGTADDPAAVLAAFEFSGDELLFSSIDYTLADNAGAFFPDFAATPRAATRAGANFSATVAVSDAQRAALDFLGLPASCVARAALGWRPGVYTLDLVIEHVAQLNVGPLALAFSSLALRFELGRPAVVPAISPAGTLAIASAHFEFFARFDPANRTLELGLRGFPNFAELAGLVGFADVGDYLPGPLSAVGDLSLRAVTAEFDLNDASVNRLSFDVGTEHPVTIVPGVVSIEPTLSVDYYDPFGEYPGREFVLSGVWRLGASELDTRLTLPEFQLTAELPPGRSLDVAAATAALLPGVVLPAIDVVDLELRADFTNATFDLEMEVLSDWAIDVFGARFAFEELSLAASYAAGAITDCTLEGRMNLAGLGLSIQAEYDAETRWIVRGGTQPGSALHVVELFAALSAQAGFGGILDDVPTSLRTLAIGKIYVEYAEIDGRFLVSGALAQPLRFTDDFAIENVYVQFVAAAGGWQGECYLAFDVGDVAIFLRSTVQSDGSWTFAGGTAPDDVVPVGRLFETIGAKFGVHDLPEVIAGMTLANLRVSYATASGAFAFACEGTIPVAGDALQLSVQIELSPGPGGAGYTKHVHGLLEYAGVNFELDFAGAAAGSTLRAVFRDEEHPLALADLAAGLGVDLSVLPPALSPALKEITFVYDRHDARQTLLLITVTAANRRAAVIRRAPTQGGGAPAYLFYLLPELDFDLRGLPVVGELIPVEDNIRARDLRVSYASRAFDAQEITELNVLLSGGASAAALQISAPQLNSGVELAAELSWAGTAHALSFATSNAATNVDNAAPVPDRNAPPPVAGSDARWFEIHKTFGPVEFARAGVDWNAGRLVFLLDATLLAGPMRIGLIGLNARFPLRMPPGAPEFGLRGLSLAMDSGPIVVRGGLVSVPQAAPEDFRYDGEVRVSTPEFMLSAVGSYARKSGETSLFIFGFLAQPLGGPPYFFVTGLAAGLGIHSELRIPPVDDLANFALLKGILSDDPAQKFSSSGTDEALARLGQDVRVSSGSQWFAAGVRFTSFEMIRSFALVTVNAGARFEIALLGLSHMALPSRSADPIAFAEVALQARLSPDEGLLRVDGRLTRRSYVLSRDCHLWGGFAFYTWFDGPHAGDFVLSLGGYHPRFAVPDHYPRVPRLSMNWQVSGNLDVKGDAYFALTPVCLMAGGNLDVLWHSGDLEAWFDSGADFILYWKPFHYEADFRVRLGASYRVNLLFTSFRVTVHLGVDVSLWGPSFAGRAHVDLSIVSFTIHFGSSSPDRRPIPYAEFKASFLPADPVKAVITAGILKDRTAESTADEPQYVVDAGHFAAVSRSLVPAKSARVNAVAYTGGGDLIQNFGLNPVGVAAADFASEHAITIQKRNDATGDFEIYHDFTFAPITSAVPAALYKATPTAPGLNDERLIPGLLTGFRAAPRVVSPDVLQEVELAELAYEHTSRDRIGAMFATPDAPDAEDFSAALSSDGREFSFGANGATFTNQDFVLSAAAAPAVSARRAAVVTALGAAGFASADAAQIDVSRLSTDTRMNDWPMLARPGQAA